MANKFTAKSGRASVSIQANRPSWKDMVENYPTMDRSALYNDVIKGSFLKQENTSYLQNTCATRMSHALNKSGIKLGIAISGKAGTMNGVAGNYWIRVRDLKTEIAKRFKNPESELKHDLITFDADQIITNPAITPTITDLRKKFLARVEVAKQFIVDKINEKTGIIVFEVSGWDDASGHFTLWDKNKMLYAPGEDDTTTGNYYPWLIKHAAFSNLKKEWVIPQTTTIKFWELK